MKYDAFISYRHTELDKFVAENLHKKLEAFRLPKSIVKQRGKDCKKRIERVFRDRDELPLATNLADPITEALENSEFLIVICSPRLPQSMWCKEEIETFIDMHGREKVLAVLIEGEPEESFPEELLYRTREITHEDGTAEVIRESVEPLAADVRGNTKKEILKKMDEELLRLVAAMFECGYDDLKQRHKEQKMKKMLTASLAASAFFLVFGAVSTTMAIRIQSQKEQIQTQSQEIQAKSEEIRSQKEEIEVQYHQALYNQSLSMAEDSLELLEEGDRIGALQTAYKALGVAEDGTPMPVTADAQYALAESAYLYRDGYSVIPTYMLEYAANIALIQISPNEKHMLAIDDYGTIYVRNIVDNRDVCTFTGDYYSSLEEDECLFITDNLILFDNEMGWAVYDIEKQSIACESDDKMIRGTASKDGAFFAVVLSKGVEVYETATFTNVFSYSYPEDKSGGIGLTFSEDGNYFVFSQIPHWQSEKSGSVVSLVRLEDSEIVKEWEMEYSAVQQIGILDDILYVAVNQTVADKESEENYVEDYSRCGCLYAYNLDDLSLKWKYENPKYNIQFFGMNSGLKDGHILVAFSMDICLVDRESGKEDFFVSFGTSVKEAFFYLNQDDFAIITRDGNYHFLNGDTGNVNVYIGYFCSTVTDLEMITYVNDGFFLMPYASNRITYMEHAAGPDMELVRDVGHDISDVWVNESETRALVDLFDLSSGEENQTLLIDLTTGEEIDSFATSDYSVYSGMVGGGSECFFIYTKSKLTIYSIHDGSFVREYDYDTSVYAERVKVSDDGKYLILVDGCSFYVVNFETGEREEIEANAEITERSVIELSNGMDFYAVTKKEEEAILLYKKNDAEAYGRIEVVVHLVENIFFTQDDKYMVVTYVNGSAEVFETDTGACVSEFEPFASHIKRIIPIGENEGYMAVCTSDAYIISPDWEVVARIDGGVAAMPETGLYLGVSYGSLFSFPAYSLEELKAEAEKILRAYNAME